MDTNNSPSPNLFSNRSAGLRDLLKRKPFLRALETHSALTGMIVEQLSVERNKTLREFDAMWCSSLTDATVRGKPDTDVIELSSRIATLKEIQNVTTKPVIFDANTGGDFQSFQQTVQALEHVGASAVVIEDKTGEKRNSLCPSSSGQMQATVAEFSKKISIGKNCVHHNGLMIIARIESFILGSGLNDAITRAREYSAAGADGILIHSKHNSADEVIRFADRFRATDTERTLIVVPTTYDDVHEDDLLNCGINIVVYANHLLRAAYPAMRRAAENILLHGRAKEATYEAASMIEILSIVNGNL